MTVVVVSFRLVDLTYLPLTNREHLYSTISDQHLMFYLRCPIKVIDMSSSNSSGSRSSSSGGSISSSSNSSSSSLSSSSSSSSSS